MSLYDELTSILEAHGFALENVQVLDSPSEALFVKPRPGGASIYVTIPLDCDTIADSVIVTNMGTAQIPAIHWRHLLKNPDA